MRQKPTKFIKEHSLVTAGKFAAVYYANKSICIYRYTEKGSGSPACLPSIPLQKYKGIDVSMV